MSCHLISTLNQLEPSLQSLSTNENTPYNHSHPIRAHLATTIIQTKPTGTLPTNFSLLANQKPGLLNKHCYWLKKTITPGQTHTQTDTTTSKPAFRRQQ